MNTYVVEMLTTNRQGGLVDKAITVRAASAEQARAAAEAKYPDAAIGYVGPEVA